MNYFNCYRLIDIQSLSSFNPTLIEDLLVQTLKFEHNICGLVYHGNIMKLMILILTWAMKLFQSNDIYKDTCEIALSGYYLVRNYKGKFSFYSFFSWIW